MMFDFLVLRGTSQIFVSLSSVKQLTAVQLFGKNHETFKNTIKANRKTHYAVMIRETMNSPTYLQS